MHSATQVRHLVASNAHAPQASVGEDAPPHEDKALLDVKVNGCFIKHHYQPPSCGNYLSEVIFLLLRAHPQL